MSCFRGRVRLFALFSLGLAALGAVSCGHGDDPRDVAGVQQVFATCQGELMSRAGDQAAACAPASVDAYLARLNATAGEAEAPALSSPPSATPSVDLLLRTVLERKAPPDLRARLTLATVLQRVLDRHIFDPNSVQAFTIDHVAVNDDHASAELYDRGIITGLRLPFLKENGAWKIDVLTFLPYAEMLMQVGRTIRRQTETQQVDDLVRQIPAL